MSPPDRRWPAHHDLPIHRAFLAELRTRPMATSMVVASVWCGVSALILGEGASRAFTIIGGDTGGGALIAHVMGAFLLIGGLMAAVGSLRLGLFVELFGLGLISAGAALYGLGVLIGLHANGLIAGGFALGLAVGAALRVVLLFTAAKRLLDDAH